MEVHAGGQRVIVRLYSSSVGTLTRFVILCVVLFTPGCLGLFDDNGGGGGSAGPAPEIDGTYTVTEYRSGSDCDNTPEPAVPMPYALLKLEVAGEDRLRIVPCRTEDDCDAELGNPVFYRGSGVWGSTRATAYTPSTGDCRLEYTETELILIEDGVVEVRQQDRGTVTDYVPVLNPCESEQANEGLPCEGHVVLEGVL